MQKAFLGFAAGVMIAASVWSLLIPAINEAEALGRIGWIPAAGGFALGVLFLMGLDKAMPYFLPEPEREEGVRRGQSGRECLFSLSHCTISWRAWQ